MQETGSRLIVPLHPKRHDGVPFFMVSGLGGHALSSQLLTSGVPEPWVGRGLQYPSFLPEEPEYRTFEAMAERLIHEVMASQQQGPYILVGYSMGGLLCVELAREVLRRGHRTAIVLIDVKLFEHAPFKPLPVRVASKIGWLLRDTWAKASGSTSKRDGRIATQRRLSHTPEQAGELPAPFARAIAEGRAALDSYKLRPVGVPSVLIRCSELARWDALRTWPHDYGWGAYTDNRGVLVSPGDHLGMIQGPNLLRIGAAMGEALSIVYEATQDLPITRRPQQFEQINP